MLIFLEFFHLLGHAILDRWTRVNLDAYAFPDIASAALAERPPASHVDPLDVVRWVHDAPLLPPQADVTTDFGQPPITVFHCEHFYIDVLFWVDGTTAIHQHRFSGAFHVMDGSSVQSTYQFTPTRRFSERLSLGHLALSRVELLRRGDTRPIVAGAGLIHALFHLDRPSVSVVVRTPTDAFAGPQYTYTRAGIAHDPFAKDETTTRKLQSLDLLHKLAHPDFEKLVRESLERADALLAFRLLAHLAKRLETPERFSAFLTGFSLRHDGLLEAMHAYAEEEHRDHYIIARRRLAKQPEHRFFLALLLNHVRREPILELVRQAHPDQEPVMTILRWLSELARLDAIHAWVADASKAAVATKDVSILDVTLDAESLSSARDLLDGRTSLPAVGPASPAVEALRKSILLRPLFS